MRRGIRYLRINCLVEITVIIKSIKVMICHKNYDNWRSCLSQLDSILQEILDIKHFSRSWEASYKWIMGSVISYTYNINHNLVDNLALEQSFHFNFGWYVFSIIILSCLTSFIITFSVLLNIIVKWVISINDFLTNQEIR